MAKIYVLFADGTEEIEGLTVVDILRRGGQETITVSVTGRELIEGSHNIRFYTDRLFDEKELKDGDMLVLPGGGNGTKALAAHEGVRKLLTAYCEADKYIGAICAAPSVLGMNGLLRGKRATCYPGFEEKLLGAEITGEAAVIDGRIITGKGMGVSKEFALALLSVLDDGEAKRVAESIQTV